MTMILNQVFPTRAYDVTMHHAARYKWAGMCDSSFCDTCQVGRKSVHGSLLCTSPPAGGHILEQILPVMASQRSMA